MGCLGKKKYEIKYTSGFCKGGDIGEVNADLGKYSIIFCNLPKNTDRPIVNYTAEIELGKEVIKLEFEKPAKIIKPGECKTIKTKTTYLTGRILKVKYIEDLNPPESEETETLCIAQTYVD